MEVGEDVIVLSLLVILLSGQALDSPPVECRAIISYTNLIFYLLGFFGGSGGIPQS